MYILTFDVEEWFHLLDNDSTKTETEWSQYEVRIHKNMERIFRILEETDTKATFFVIGWIAKKYPEIVREISRKYEIGSHTFNHQLVWEQNPKMFRQDVSDSVTLLEDLTGKPVKYFRAPGFSIRESEGWAFEAIKSCGIEIDCSIFPAHHAHGGMPNYGTPKPSLISCKGITIKEFPICTKQIAGRHIIVSGGGYFRLLPYYLIKKWSLESSEYLLSYIHPRDLDAEQPIISSLPISRKFKSYVGLKGAETKLKQWLNDFNFTDLHHADQQIDWTKVPIIEV